MKKALAICYTVNKGGAAKGFQDFLQRFDVDISVVTADRPFSFRYLYCRLMASCSKIFFFLLSSYPQKLSLSKFALTHKAHQFYDLALIGWCGNHFFDLSSDLESCSNTLVRVSDEWWHLGLRHYSETELHGRTELFQKFLDGLARTDLERKKRFAQKTKGLIFVFPSAWMKMRFLEVHRDFEESKCVVVRNPFPPLGNVPSKKPLPENQRKIAFVAADLFDGRKNIGALFDLEEKIRDSFLWVFLGNAEKTDALRLEQSFKHMEFKGFQAEQQLESSLSSCDFIVHTAAFDNSPNGFLHGLARNLVPICIDEGGAIEYVPDECRDYCYSADGDGNQLSDVLKKAGRLGSEELFLQKKSLRAALEEAVASDGGFENLLSKLGK